MKINFYRGCNWSNEPAFDKKRHRKKNWIGPCFFAQTRHDSFFVPLWLCFHLYGILYSQVHMYFLPLLPANFFIRVIHTTEYTIFSSTYGDCEFAQLELHLPHTLSLTNTIYLQRDKKKSNKNTGNLEIWCIVNTILNVSSVLLQFTWCTAHIQIKCVPENIYISIGIFFYSICIFHTSLKTHPLLANNE